MKRIKIAMVALLVTTGLVASFAFTNKKAHKPVNMTTYYYIAAHKFIGSGNTNSLVESEVKDATNSWTATDPTYTLGTGDYLATINFDRDAFTKQEGFNEVWNYYNSHTQTLPADQGTFTVVKNSVSYTFTVRRKATN
jgi:hypothetical protein